MAKKQIKKQSEPESVQVKEPVLRQPSAIEVSYVEEHYVKDGLTPSQLYAKLPGVDPQAIDKLIANVIPEMKQGQTPIERLEQLAKVTTPVGNLMGHDHENGVVVMTQNASELADARRVAAVPSPDRLARQKTDRIHVIDPNKRIR